MEDWYDHPKVYDVLCGWDTIKERSFVLGASRRFGVAEPRCVLEPFCGSGRMLRALGGRTFGFDVNPAMVRYAARWSHVARADATRLPVASARFDLALCLIDSFRHLRTGEQAEAHLREVARALMPGAVYVLGFDVTGGGDPDVSADDWEMERDGMRVRGQVQGLGDRADRLETVRVGLEIEEAGTTHRMETFKTMRTYSPAEVEEMLRVVGGFELVSCHARDYDLERVCDLDDIYGSAVLVLRRLGVCPSSGS